MRILVMRHAEKSGDPRDPNLTEAGRARAKALATFIPKKFGRPDFIFATSRSEHSDRPRQTVTPLSEAISVEIDTTFSDQDYGALAATLLGERKFRSKLIVVCWHHGNIPNLLNALKAVDGQYPDPWNRGVFNLIVELIFNSDPVPVAKQITEPF